MTVSDAGGSISTVPFVATASTPSLQSASVNPVEGTALNNALLATLAGASGQSLVASDYTASINWGDGSAPTAGLVAVDGGVLGIEGSHTYISSGSYQIQVTVATPGNPAVTSLSFPVTATPTPLVLSGTLNPASDSGQSNSDGITNVTQPNFYGTSEPGSIIQLYAIPTGGGTPSLIGAGTTEASGTWSVTSSVLADGSYTILAQATDPHGGTTTTTQVLPNANEGPLVIDTAGPQVMGVSFNRLSGKVTVAFEDDISGLNQSQLNNAANYQLVGRSARFGTYPISAIAMSGSGLGSPEVVTLQYRGGTRFPNAQYLFTVVSSAGIQDIAGNTLDGRYSGSFPSGQGEDGSDFVARVVLNGNRVSTLAVSTGSPTVPTIGSSHPKVRTTRFVGRRR